MKELIVAPLITNPPVSITAYHLSLSITGVAVSTLYQAAPYSLPTSCIKLVFVRSCPVSTSFPPTVSTSYEAAPTSFLPAFLYEATPYQLPSSCIDLIQSRSVPSSFVPALYQLSCIKQLRIPFLPDVSTLYKAAPYQIPRTSPGHLSAA